MATRLSGRKESTLQTIQILLLALTGETLPDCVQFPNLIALDRGYLAGAKTVSWLCSIGARIVVTHQRISSFLFTFGDERTEQQLSNRRQEAEVGAKSVYWAAKTIEGVRCSALAYRMGCNRVATVFTSTPDIDMGRFVYTESRCRLTLPPSDDVAVTRHSRPANVRARWRRVA